VDHAAGAAPAALELDEAAHLAVAADDRVPADRAEGATGLGHGDDRPEGLDRAGRRGGHEGAHERKAGGDNEEAGSAAHHGTPS
jgi:hypothetical protein